jgi:sulfite oxidase
MLKKMKKVGHLHPDDHYHHLPFYTRADIGKHRTVETGIWMSYGDGVYDVTEFVKRHPGGSSKIVMAAGGAIEPFWEMYPFHKQESIKSILK